MGCFSQKQKEPPQRVPTRRATSSTDNSDNFNTQLKELSKRRGIIHALLNRKKPTDKGFTTSFRNPNDNIPV